MDDFEPNTSENEELREENERTKSSNSALIVFILLLALVTGLLVYYQFYQGNGKWRFTLLHKANDTTFLTGIKGKTVDTARARKDTARVVIADSTPKKDTMQHVNAPVDTIQTTNVAAQPQKLKHIKVDEELPVGTVYEVQIGTFEHYSLKHYDAVFNNLHEERVGKLTKLTLGRFSSQKEADAFRKDMVKLGVKHAWVVKKVDGKRS
jgi:hypothetical protein